MTEQRTVIFGYNDELAWFVKAEKFNIDLDALSEWRCEQIIKALFKLMDVLRD